MLRHINHPSFKLALCSAVLYSSMTQAGEEWEPELKMDEEIDQISAATSASSGGMIQSLTDFNINDTEILRENDIQVGGWVEVGIAGNPDDPVDRFNTPVTFNDRANEFNMHQLYGYIEKTVDTAGDKWDFGFRADILYGTDARFSPTANLDDHLISDSSSRFYKLVFPQTYVEVFAPIGNGITTKIGHFYTIIGNEVVTAPDNFFFSHAYTMQYGEPFTHTGLLMSYPVNDNISISGGVVSGWDSFFQEPANFLGGVSYSNDEGSTSVAFSLVTGDVDKTDEHNRTMYSIVFNHDFMEDLHYTFQHDLGVEEKSTTTPANTKWYGINQYLTYDIDNDLAAGVRFEWFRDEGGTRVTGQSDHFFAMTAGLNYSPFTWLTLRPEVRYDWTVNTTPYIDGTQDDQVLISADAIITF